MSDVERPGNGESGNGGGRVPARNMADIARLFLDGARPVKRDGPAASGPKRMPPTQPASPAPARSAQQPVDESRPAVMLALAGDPHDPETRKHLLHAAHGLADEQATTVALVGILQTGAKRTFVVDVVGVESADELPIARMPADAAGATDMQIARALHRLRPAVGLWLIAGPEAESRSFPAIASIVHDWLLACPTDDRGLVAGYQYLKKAWVKGALGGGKAVKPAVYLLSDDYAHAAIVHKRLRKAAQEFLKTDLVLAGAGPVRDHAGHEEPVRVLAMACEEARGGNDALWAAVLDELCPMNESEEAGADREIETAMGEVEERAAQVALQSTAATVAVLDHLAQVLDPEERAALSAVFPDYDEEPPVSPIEISPAKPRVEAEESARDLVARELLEDAMPAPPIARQKVRRIDAPPAREPDAEEPRPVKMPVQTGQVRGMVPAMEKPPVVPAVAKKVEPVSEVGVVREHLPQVLPAAKAPAGPSLRAFDMEASADREMQWQAVERSIWDLSPRSALLDAKPPMSWAAETCISIDGAGRLNVWTLYKDGASWFALREWASEHRNLLALTRRDLTVNRDMEVAVHIVLPLEEAGEAKDPSLGVVGVLMRTPTPNVRLYRLRQVQWHDRRGMVVVPLA